MTKIGMSDDVKSRLSALETACGCRLELKYFTKPLKIPIRYEKQCHEYFKDNRTHGEWFNISPGDAISYVSHVEKTAEVDSIVDLYVNKQASITEISDKMGVTRQAIIKKLKKYGLHKHTEQPIIKQPQVKEKIKKDCDVVVSMGCYERIGNNLYKSKKDNKQYKIIYTNGQFRRFAV